MGTPDKYIKDFRNKIKWVSTVQISYPPGNVRGYFVISNGLGYFSYRRWNQIVVFIQDPNLNGPDGAFRTPYPQVNVEIARDKTTALRVTA